MDFRGSLMAAKSCPVCDWEIVEGGITVKVGAREITVCCEECAAKAKEDPARLEKTAG
jgi:hypothetical protein